MIYKVECPTAKKYYIDKVKEHKENRCPYCALIRFKENLFPKND